MKHRALTVAGILVGLAAAFVAGRYSRPVEVREIVRTETKWRVHVAWWLQRTTKEIVRERRNVKVVRVEVPGGPVTTTTTDLTAVDSETDSSAITMVSGDGAGTESVQSEKVTTVSAPRFRVGAGVGVDFRDGADLVGDLSASYRFLGPLRAEVIATKPLDGKPEYGARLKVEFEF